MAAGLAEEDEEEEEEEEKGYGGGSKRKVKLARESSLLVRGAWCPGALVLGLAAQRPCGRTRTALFSRRRYRSLAADSKSKRLRGGGGGGGE